MDQKQLIIAIAISFVILTVWQMFFVPKQTKQVQPDIKKEAATEQETPKVEKKTFEELNDISHKEIEPKTIIVENSLYRAELSNRGAAITSFKLKKYKETNDENSIEKELISKTTGNGSILTSYYGNKYSDLSKEYFFTDNPEDTIEIIDGSREIVFKWVGTNGVMIEKKYIFNHANYMVGLNISVKNGSNSTIDNVYVTLTKDVTKKARGYSFEGPSALIDTELEEIDISDIEDQDLYKGILKWVAIQDTYFMTAIIPVNVIETQLRLSLNTIIQKDEETQKEKTIKELRAHYIQPAKIDPGTEKEYAFNIFMGPKKITLLEGYHNDLDKVIDFGWFDILAKPCLKFMNFLYNYIPNYGLVIIVLTIILKLLLWPLGSKSYKSMGEMKKIQPLVAELREKYKDDKKKLNEETMALYRTYKVNPVGGCLPMLVQFPVIIALYRMLGEAIELRHAPFFGWINDLSAPDRLFNFSFSNVPLMEPPYGIPVLTLLMGGSMFLQQKMSPPMGDPAQAKMMMALPIVFTFIFINFSSGLVLYWFISNIISMGQQYYIQKKAA